MAEGQTKFQGDQPLLRSEGKLVRLAGDAADLIKQESSPPLSRHRNEHMSRSSDKRNELKSSSQMMRDRKVANQVSESRREQSDTNESSVKARMADHPRNVGIDLWRNHTYTSDTYIRSQALTIHKAASAVKSARLVIVMSSMHIRAQVASYELASIAEQSVRRNGRNVM